MSESLIWGAETHGPIGTKFCMLSAVYEVIPHASLGEDWLRGFGVARVKFWAIPLS